MEKKRKKKGKVRKEKERKGKKRKGKERKGKKRKGKERERKDGYDNLSRGLCKPILVVWWGDLAHSRRINGQIRQKVTVKRYT